MKSACIRYWMDNKQASARLAMPIEPAQQASPLINIDGLSAALARFAQERHWEQFHLPKNLVMALTGEVGELSEIFQWLDADASRGVADDPQTAEAVRDELADVTMYLVRLASVLGVDLNAAVAEKMRKNALKYPVSKAHGSSKKYNQFE